MDAPEQDRKHRTRVIAAPVAAVTIFTALGFGSTVLVRAQIVARWEPGLVVSGLRPPLRYRTGGMAAAGPGSRNRAERFTYAG